MRSTFVAIVILAFLTVAPDVGAKVSIRSPEKRTASEASEEKGASRQKARAVETSDGAKASETLEEASEPEAAEADAPELSEEERAARYPVVQEALTSTLEELVPTKELKDVAVLKAISRVPRVNFVPKEYKNVAYRNIRIPLGEGRFLAAQFDVAFALESLELQSSDRLLIVGDGSGYWNAVASVIVDKTRSVDDSKVLYKRALETYKRLNWDAKSLLYCENCLDFTDDDLFDKIAVVRALEEVPDSLLDLLKDGGRLIAPVGDRYDQRFALYEKVADAVEQKNLVATYFEPLDDATTSIRDPLFPELLGGDFENSDDVDFALDDGAKEKEKTDSLSVDEIVLPVKRPTPRGWRGARNCGVEALADAFEGGCSCVCDNWSVRLEQEKKDRNEEREQAATLPEDRKIFSEEELLLRKAQRTEETVCQLLQTVPVNGGSVKRIILSGAYCIDRLETCEDSQDVVSLVKIAFTDQTGRLIRNGGESVVLESEPVVSEWQEFEREILVPARAVEATVTIGILDGVGVVKFDALGLRNKKERSSR